MIPLLALLQTVVARHFFGVHQTFLSQQWLGVALLVYGLGPCGDINMKMEVFTLSSIHVTVHSL
jgi:hypothetical protein